MNARRTADLSGVNNADLRDAGWQRCFVADEPRLSEAVETYEEIGFEVLVLPVRADEAECTECMRQNPDRFSVIYCRRRASDPEP